MVDFSGATNVTAYQQAFSADAWSILLPVLFYTVGIAVYAIIVWHFYRHLARRDIFHLHVEKSKTRWDKVKSGMKYLIHAFKYVILFPLLVFVWFAVLSALLLLLSKNQTLPTILLISMGVVAAVRVTAYYSEDLSKDLAKMLPFALLGVFLVDRAFLNFEMIKANFAAIPQFAPTILLYGLFVVALELILRLTHVLLKQVSPAYKENTELPKG